MSLKSQSPGECGRESVARLVIDFLHRTVMHHAMWFGEVERRLGRERAEGVLREAYAKTLDIQLKRLSKTLGFEVREGLPAPLLDLPEEKLRALLETVAVNWLATDGVWFQAVEFSSGMEDARACNDACWARFSPLEAFSIRRFLDLPESPGLEGLKRALAFRLYAAVNKQSIAEETPSSFVFRMDDCRVQSARKRKSLPDYPCKAAGIVEYRAFASAIDPRIRTDCVACPPDPHPDEWFCAWRFSLDGK
ncbi:MAG: DUF6125 family protein [Candidatus Eisenbacteria bacterium]